MIMEARICATAMRHWRQDNWPAARDRRDLAQLEPLAAVVTTWLYAFREGLCEQAEEMIRTGDFQGVYKLLEEALETGARAQRGDYG
jgi:hypothetical protein